MKRGRIRSAVSKFIARVAVVAYLGWDAGMRWNPNTSRGTLGWPWGGVQTPDEANDPVSRCEIIRKAQQLERNNWFAIALGEVWTTYVTPGVIRSASSDAEWNKRADEAFADWCELPDLTSTQDFDSFKDMAVWRSFFDGAGYIYKTRGETPPYRPRVQFIEAAMIQTPSTMSGRKDIFDGVERDARGRKVAYYVRQVINGDESFIRIPARDIIPICDLTRPGETHSFSYLAAVLDDLQDLKELAAYAMDKAKEAAEIKNVYETFDGEIPSSEELTKQARELTTETASGTAQTVQRQQAVRKILGGRSVAIQVGEKISQLQAGSPNQIEQEHWRIACERVCAGTRIPIILILPESIQGTVARAALDHANTNFRKKSAMYQKVFVQVRNYVIDQISQYDVRIADKPSDWKKCVIRHPRGCNVDIGRNSNAMIAEVEAGLRTMASCYDDLGEDGREQITAVADEAAFIDQLAKERGITPDRIRSSIGDSLKIQLQADAANQAAQDAETVNPKQKAAA